MGHARNADGTINVHLTDEQRESLWALVVDKLLSGDVKHSDARKRLLIIKKELEEAGS